MPRLKIYDAALVATGVAHHPGAVGDCSAHVPLAVDMRRHAVLDSYNRSL